MEHGDKLPVLVVEIDDANAFAQLRDAAYRDAVVYLPLLVGPRSAQPEARVAVGEALVRALTPRAGGWGGQREPSARFILSVARALLESGVPNAEQLVRQRASHSPAPLRGQLEAFLLAARLTAKT